MSDDSIRDINDILDDYADGLLGAEDGKKLLKAVESSAEIRERLAIITIIERLLRTPHISHASIEKIMGALPKADTKAAAKLREGDGEKRKHKKLVHKKEKRHNRQIKERKKESWNRDRTSYRQDRPSAIWAVFLICLLVAGGVFYKIKEEKTADYGLPTTEEKTADYGLPTTEEKTADYGLPTTENGIRTTDGGNEVPNHQPVTITLEEVDGDDGFVPPLKGLKKYETSIADKIRPKLDGEVGSISTPIIHAIRKHAPVSQVLISKVRRGDQEWWNATPNDVDNLLRELKVVAGFTYTAEDKTLGELMSSSQRPVIYYSSHYKFELDNAERQWMKDYMLKGGTVIFNTGLGSLPAYKSAIRELKMMFPENPPQPLSSDHPVYRSYFDMQKVKYGSLSQAVKDSGTSPRFDGITMNCRTLALVSRWDLSIGWEGIEDETYSAYSVTDARKIGINIISYAIAQRAWVKQAAQISMEDYAAPSLSKLFIAQVVYNGEWKTRSSGLSILLHTFNHKTDVPVKLGVKELSLTDPDIFKAPLLYMTGHNDFYLSEPEVKQLRSYLKNGGLLFAESCCGREGFDKAFRAEIERVLTNEKFAPIPQDSSIYSHPNAIGKIGVTPSLAAKLGDVLHAPALEGIKQDGHYAVIYSRYGLAGGWETSQNPYSDGYNDVGAILLGQNILMHAITQ